MKDEIVIKQLAELGGVLTANLFLLIMLYENHGADTHNLINAVDELMRTTADINENRMRKEAGLKPREKPRESELAKFLFSEIDWSKMKEN